MSYYNDEVLLRIYHGLVRDVAEILGLDLSVLERDFTKVSRSTKKRGESFLLVELPELCSALEQGLESGEISTNGMAYGTSSIPNLFRTVFLLIFDEEGMLRRSVDPEAVRCLRQLLKVFKKLRVPCPDSATQEKYHEFAEIEMGIIPPCLSWGDHLLRVVTSYPNLVDLGRRVITRQRDRGLDIGGPEGSLESEDVYRDLSYIQLAADSLLKSFRYREQWFRPKHGPGAVSEPYGSSKFEFPSWPGRLEYKFPFAEWGLANLSFWGTDDFTTEQSAAKLIGVPKDYRGPRLIASEPISAQYIQQGLMQVIRKNVAKSPLRYCIDFRSQEPSRTLALAASKTRGLSTIDLSSASDRLSCALVECMFRSNFSFLEILNSARTPSLNFPNGEQIELKKFAAQGAAFTFPVQSIIYALICIGVLKSDNPDARWADLAEQVRVFGDDMIVPTRLFSRICACLEAVGLKVNGSKSFYKGGFRESCGLDAYNGQVVTTTAIMNIFSKRDPGSIVSIVEQSNNLYLAGFIHASRKLQETIPWKFRKKIPWVSPGSTVFGFVGNGDNRLRTRWNAYLHRHESETLTVDSKVIRTSVDGHLRLFQWFIENPGPETVWSPGYVKGVKARYRLRWTETSRFRTVG